jgi:uncharacterized membrane protein YeaQ/YmgE (transglycosylase-associated protein family)
MLDNISDIINYPLICCGWVFIGFFAGGIARYIMRSDDKPFWNDLVLGLGGAFLGGLVASFLGIVDDANKLNFGNVLILFVAAVGGAMFLVLFGRKFLGNRGPSGRGTIKKGKGKRKSSRSDDMRRRR